MAVLRSIIGWLQPRPWVVALLWLVPALGLPAVPIDETRYLSVAWEMHRSGDLVGLTLNGQPYMDKPPLLFWLVNAMWALFGASTVGARVVGIAAGSAAVAATVWLARRLGQRDPAIAGWLLLPFVMFGAFTVVTLFDVPLLLFVVLAFVGMVGWIDERRSGWLALLAVAAVFGMLAKGPVFLLHMAGPLALWRWWHGDTPAGASRVTVAMIGVVLAAGLPLLAWGIAASARSHHGSVIDAIVHQAVGRVAESFAHRRGPAWYLPLLLPFLMPWTLLFRWRAARAMGKAAMRSRGGRFGIAASLPALVMFSIVSGKQIHYLIPLLPGAALVLAAMHEREGPCIVHGRARWLLLAAAAAWLWAIVSAGVLGDAGGRLALLASALLLCAGAVATFGVGRDPARDVATASIAALFALMSTVLLLGTHLSARMDPAELAVAVNDTRARGVTVAATADEPGLVNFLARLPTPLPVIDDPVVWSRDHPDAFALVKVGQGAPPPFVRTPIVLADGWEGLVPAPALADVHAPIGKPPSIEASRGL